MGVKDVQAQLVVDFVILLLFLLLLIWDFFVLFLPCTENMNNVIA